MNRHKGWMIALAFAAADLPVLTWGQPAPEKETPVYRQNFRDRYTIVSEQNVFLRDRRRRRDDRDERPRERPAPPRREEELFALRGVVFEDGQYRAYVENLSSSTMLRLGVGDTLARGRIAQMQIDSIEYEQGGQRTWVDVGKNLTGSVAATMPASQPAGGSESGASSLPINPNDPNLTIEQRMRLRRQQQLGGSR